MEKFFHNVYAGLEPAQVWRHFAALNDVPRPSGEEAAARGYVKAIAMRAGLGTDQDDAGNLVVYVPATAGKAGAKVTAIQAHLDMVCQQQPGGKHNFSRDPIRVQRVGDAISARGTTLGADNGVGVALALALLTSTGLAHGPLELLFTVEEETGLYGAMGLDVGMLQAHYLINLDSEDPDELTVGCAGGKGVDLVMPLTRQARVSDGTVLEVRVGGLRGGHSGVQIHEPLANAIKLLVQVLTEAESTGFRLVDFSGGTAHNVIPRDALALVEVQDERVAEFKAAVTAASAAIAADWTEHEERLEIEVGEAGSRSANARPLDAETTKSVLALLSELPHGVVAMSPEFAGKVETSSNLATVETHDSTVEIHVSSRSFVAAALEQQQRRVAGLGDAAGAVCVSSEGYPGWQPNPSSRLLELAKQAFFDSFGKEPAVEVVHAGLECGVIVAKNPELDAISFGPLIRFAHSPDECLYASTVAPIWQLLVSLLGAIAITRS